jgi:CheY-like chemotaxis protein
MENRTILVIEDNALNMKLVRTLLKVGKYDIIEAIDAETGIQSARECKPDLILMDIQLPGMDGLNATKIIKEDPSLKNVKILALTSHAMEGDDKKALNAGCDGYIVKPIDTKNFLDTIGQYLRG